MDEDTAGASLGNPSLACAGAANSTPRYLALCLNRKVARELSELHSAQIVSRAACSTELELYDNLPSMELIDFGLNILPRSLTYPCACSSTAMSRSERLRPLTG
jgi:hypothetical protein